MLCFIWQYAITTEKTLSLKPLGQFISVLFWSLNGYRDTVKSDASYSCFHLVGDAENIEKFNRRLVKVTKQHNEECKQLLQLMGIPYVDVSD